MNLTNEVLGYEDSSLTLCIFCWRFHNPTNSDSIGLITASIQAEKNETIICDKCGSAIWE